LSAVRDFHGAVLSLDEERVWCQLFVVIPVECGKFGLALEHRFEDLLGDVDLAIAELGLVGTELSLEDRLGGVGLDTAEGNVIRTIPGMGTSRISPSWSSASRVRMSRRCASGKRSSSLMANLPASRKLPASDHSSPSPPEIRSRDCYVVAARFMGRLQVC
jgi:hypothetical protein